MAVSVVLLLLTFMLSATSQVHDGQPIHILSENQRRANINLSDGDEVTFMMLGPDVNASVEIKFDTLLTLSWDGNNVTLQKNPVSWSYNSPNLLSLTFSFSNESYEILREGQCILKKDWMNNESSMNLETYLKESIDSCSVLVVVGPQFPWASTSTSTSTPPSTTMMPYNEEGSISGIVVLMTTCFVVTLLLLLASVAFIVILLRQTDFPFYTSQKSCNIRQKTGEGREVMEEEATPIPPPRSFERNQMTAGQQSTVTQYDDDELEDNYIRPLDVKPIEVEILKKQTQLTGNVRHHLSPSRQTSLDTPVAKQASAGTNQPISPAHFHGHSQPYRPEVDYVNLFQVHRVADNNEEDLYLEMTPQHEDSDIYDTIDG